MADFTCSNNHNRHSDYEKKLIRYLVTCILSELSKVLIFSFIFYLLDMLPEFGTALLFLFIFRSSSGGLHCKNYISCLCVSFFVLLFGILLGETVFLPKYLTLLFTAVLGIFSYQLSPVLSLKRPPATPAIIRHARTRTLIVSLLLFAALFFLSGNQYWNMGFWLFGINTLQLFTAYIMRRCQHVPVNKDVNMVS